jgi:hypothetical protein
MFGPCYLPCRGNDPRRIGAWATNTALTQDSKLATALLRVAYVLFTALLIAALLAPGSASAASEAFQNGRLRFGTGAEASVRGSLVNGVFTPLLAPSDSSPALEISSGVPNASAQALTA